MGLNRREFIQQISGLLAAFGMSETVLWQAGDRYYQALAQPTARKLALLVGINQYPGDISLSGAVTDVALQEELLKYRFGFQSSDILTLKNEQATRANIESAFMEHLINQASAADLVVFHFSGYGRCLKWESTEENPLSKNSLVPVDGGLSDASNASKLGVNDLLEETLWQLLAMLPTKRAIAVLDTSYTYPGSNFQGNLMIRSRPSPRTSQLTSEALAFQEKLKNQTSPTSNPQNIPALILSATSPNQVATEAKLQGFSAGLFTLALTQQLWLATPATSLQSSLQKVSCTVQELGGFLQQPQMVKPGVLLKSDSRILPITPGENNGLIPVLPSADGVIKSVEEGSKTAHLWLGGLPANILETYSANSIFSLVPPTNSPESSPTTLQIRVRDGLTAKAQLLDQSTTALEAGQLLQEAVRVLPRHLNLTVALDTELQRIERVDATSAFASMPNISTVLKGEQPADCLFGRVRQDALAQSALLSPGSASLILPQGSYGLFSVGQTLLVNTVGAGGEAVKLAAQRLTPYLEMLRAAKLIGLSANQGSSRLGVRVTLEKVTPEEKLLMQASTRRAPWPSPSEGSAVSGDSSILSLAVGSRIRYRIFNYSDRPIYSFLFGIHNSGSAIAFYPFPSQNQSAKSQPEIEQNLIQPGTTLTLPDDAVGSAWSINGTVGLAKTHLICSSSPFLQTFNALKPVMGSRGDGQGIITLQNPFKIAQAVLEDLHHASASNPPIGFSNWAGISDEFWALNVNHWATLSFIYRVI
ncbi:MULTISPECIES: caspase family protein [Planktothricoides]|uniref:Caspase family protein n=2 Tax=Planktothricoides raciborskii TaxID=132608 RepID=A0AAU8JAF4_9CYAN|nr:MULTISPECIES: caspase family protein [Planktothricoides]KOR33849.1 hypothetical protein AM228_27445 [Planktothricoides sp. SR001]MBD2547878.1 caspase family protein [Planktothricoides raciborskii FACHB-1370]MBD2586287.1 caspase family protein [Planktothricoides raciborskii FACHB-1261]